MSFPFPNIFKDEFQRKPKMNWNLNDSFPRSRFQRKEKVYKANFASMSFIRACFIWDLLWPELFARGHHRCLKRHLFSCEAAARAGCVSTGLGKFGIAFI